MFYHFPDRILAMILLKQTQEKNRQTHFYFKVLKTILRFRTDSKKRNWKKYGLSSAQCKEIEVQASVLYIIQPEAENNFFQGFGVGFDDIPEELAEQLQIYIREHFLREVSASNDGVGDFTAGQLQNWLRQASPEDRENFHPW